MNRKTLAGDRRRRKMMAALWAFGLALLVILLIYFEQTAVLYILCTLGITVLLTIVARADLDQHGGASGQPVVQSTDGARER